MTEEKTFEPENFSGLNWREAKKFIGRTVGFSDNPDDGWRKDILLNVEKQKNHFQTASELHFDYIRTYPETYKHPTIKVGDTELPKPETEAPEKKTKIWEWYPGGILKSEWTGDPIVQNLLETGRIHLTQERAQTWADWWENTVINN